MMRLFTSENVRGFQLWWIQCHQMKKFHLYRKRCAMKWIECPICICSLLPYFGTLRLYICILPLNHRNLCTIRSMCALAAQFIQRGTNPVMLHHLWIVAYVKRQRTMFFRLWFRMSTDWMLFSWMLLTSRMNLWMYWMELSVIAFRFSFLHFPSPTH